MEEKTKSKATYKTKKDMFSFGRYLLSDERRAKFQAIARQKFEAKIINFTPWATAIRFIHDFDYADWIKWKKKYD
jgi:hypothetical protein